jgi:hypothetical protein
MMMIMITEQHQCVCVCVCLVLFITWAYSNRNHGFLSVPPYPNANVQWSGGTLLAVVYIDVCE